MNYGHRDPYCVHHNESFTHNLRFHQLPILRLIDSGFASSSFSPALSSRIGPGRFYTEVRQPPTLPNCTSSSVPPHFGGLYGCFCSPWLSASSPCCYFPWRMGLSVNLSGETSYVCFGGTTGICFSIFNCILRSLQFYFG